MTEEAESDRPNLPSGARSIRTNDDHQAALARIDELMDAEPGTPEGVELDALTDLIELYEAQQMPEFAAPENPKHRPTE